MPESLFAAAVIDAGMAEMTPALFGGGSLLAGVQTAGAALTGLNALQTLLSPTRPGQTLASPTVAPPTAMPEPITKPNATRKEQQMATLLNDRMNQTGGINRAGTILTADTDKLGA